MEQSWTDDRKAVVPTVQEPSTQRAANSRKPISKGATHSFDREDEQKIQISKGEPLEEFYGKDLIHEANEKIKEKVDSFRKMVNEDALTFNSKIKALSEKLDGCINHLSKQAGLTKA